MQKNWTTWPGPSVLHPPSWLEYNTKCSQNPGSWLAGEREQKKKKRCRTNLKQHPLAIYYVHNHLCAWGLPEEPRFTLAWCKRKKKVHSSFFYSGKPSPCRETLTQRSLGLARVSLDEHALMSISSLVCSLWHTRKSWCLALWRLQKVSGLLPARIRMCRQQSIVTVAATRIRVQGGMCDKEWKYFISILFVLN